MNNQLSLFYELLCQLSKDSKPTYQKYVSELSIQDKDFSNYGLMKKPNKAFKLKTDNDFSIAVGIRRSKVFEDLLWLPCLWEDCEDNYIRLRPDVCRTITLSDRIIIDGKNKGPLGFCQRKEVLQLTSSWQKPYTDDWLTWFENGRNFFSKCTGFDIYDVFDRISHNQNAQGILEARLYSREISSALHVRNLYKYLSIQKDETLNKTPLGKAIGAYLGKYSGKIIERNDLPSLVANHPQYLLGHMDTSEEAEDKNLPPLQSRELHPLDNTQRFVNFYINQLKDGEVLAVNGPPGSGKTAMMKAVIANQYVNAALNNQPCPIVVAVGDTNQSVTNVISAFPKVLYHYGSEELLHYERWLPKLNNYGSFIPAKSELKKMRKANQVDNNMILSSEGDKYSIFNWQGDGQDILTDFTKIQDLKKYYLQRARRYFEAFPDNQITSVEHAIKAIRHLLTNQQKQLNDEQKKLHSIKDNKDKLSEFFTDDLLNTSRALVKNIYRSLSLLAGTESEKIGAVESIAVESIRDNSKIDRLSLVENCQLIMIDRYLDITSRVEMFHLAARYWEGKYLIESEQEILLTATPDNLEKVLRRLCMLTPCLVSTLDSVPNLLKVYKDSISGVSEYLLNAIDLLIVDETGQASIPKGVPVLALAKKVLAVGDVVQLQPVLVDFSKESEKDLITLHGFDDKAYAEWKKQHLLTSNGSLLHLLRHASAYSFQGQGLMLRGHYRCNQKIIELCNQMVYDNKLIVSPHLKAKPPIFDPVCWVPSIEPSQPFEGSRINRAEAKSIATFVHNQWKSIYDAYKGEDKKPKIYDIIGFISPYRPQPDIIIEELKLLFEKAPYKDQYLVTEDDIKKLTSGTVNKLQGAEKPIIIFSSVKTGKDQGKLFFDDQPFLLNVALSRAKHCFIAFVCPDEYQMNEELPVSPEDEEYVKFTGQYLRRIGDKLYPKHLVIIEAPGKVDTIQSMLSCYYEVDTCKGRTYELAKRPTLNDVSAKPLYQISDDSHERVLALANKAKTMQTVIIATDNDNAGEFIGWHLAKQLEILNPSLKEKIRHVRLSKLEPEYITKLIEQFPINQPDLATHDSFTVNAEAARELVDLYIAERFSEIVKNRTSEDDRQIAEWLENGIVAPADERNLKKLENSIGRTKAAIMSLLLLKTEQNQKQIKARLRVNGKVLDGIVTKGNDAIFDYLVNNQLSMQKATPQKWKLNANLETNHQTYEGPCASTINILRLAWEHYKIKPADTMSYLQLLYEGHFNE